MFLVAMMVVLAGAEVWEEAGETKGVQVWVRDVPGGRVREVRAETVMPVAPQRIWDVLGELDKYVEFMPYVIETKRMGAFDNGHYEYQRIDPPLVDMRDYTLKVTYDIDRERGVWKRTWSEANDKGPPLPSDTVRVPQNRGSWTLEQRDGGTKVTYYLYTDPGGSLPAWIANRANTTSIPDLLDAVRKRALDPRYRR